MSEFPIVPSKTAMLFFDTLNVYYHPDNTECVIYLASCQRLLQRLCPTTTREPPYLRKTG